MKGRSCLQTVDLHFLRLLRFLSVFLSQLLLRRHESRCLQSQLDRMQLVDRCRYLVGSRKGRAQIDKDGKTRDKGSHEHRPKQLQLDGVQKDEKLLICLNQKGNALGQCQYQQDRVMEGRVDALQRRDAIDALFAQPRHGRVAFVRHVRGNDLAVGLVELVDETVQFAVKASARINDVVAGAQSRMALGEDAARVLNQLATRIVVVRACIVIIIPRREIQKQAKKQGVREREGYQKASRKSRPDLVLLLSNSSALVCVCA